MKKSLTIAIGTIAFLLAFSGCANLSQSQQSRLTTAATTAAYIGTAEVVRKHPEYRAGFELAVSELKALENGKIDTLKLIEIINRLPVKELHSEGAMNRTSMIITAATILVVDEIGATPIEELNDLKPVVMAIRSGIERGLQ